MNKKLKKSSNLEHSALEMQESNKWLLKAAQNGHAQAQFELSKNMASGKGCKQDLKVAKLWLNASVANQFKPAQSLIADQYLKENTKENYLAALNLLKSASEGIMYKAKVKLAWALSTSPFAELNDPELALELLDERNKNYFDFIHIKETEAAAYAALGDFDDAIDAQEEAIDLAEKFGWKTYPELLSRLDRYRNDKIIIGGYF